MALNPLWSQGVETGHFKGKNLKCHNYSIRVLTFILQSIVSILEMDLLFFFLQPIICGGLSIQGITFSSWFVTSFCFVAKRSEVRLSFLGFLRWKIFLRRGGGGWTSPTMLGFVTAVFTQTKFLLKVAYGKLPDLCSCQN